MELKYAWKSIAKTFTPVGSRVTCNPPPTDTDEDWLVLDLDKSVANWLSESGWEYGGSMQSEDTFASYKIDDVNVICAFTKDEYAHFKLATDVCQKLNVLKKDDRIALFEAIMYRRNATDFAEVIF